MSNGYLITIDGRTYVRSALDAVLLDDGHGWNGIAAVPGVKLAADPQDMAEASLTETLAAALDDVGKNVAKSIMAGEIVTDQQLEKAFLSALLPALTSIAMGEMLRLGGEMNVPFDPVVLRQMAVDWARDYAYGLVKGITATSRSVIADAVSSYMADTSMSMSELRNLLEPAFGTVRAGMIATTETTRAFQAAMDLYCQRMQAEHGVKLEQVWYSRENACTAICLPLDGKGEQFWRAAHPAGPPAHVNCRCRTVARVVKEPNP